MNNVSQAFESPARQERCPVNVGARVSYGWWNLLERRVEEVGEQLVVVDTHVVPVRYSNGAYGIVRYRKGGDSPLSIDEMSDVRPNASSARILLRHSSSMPQILPIEEKGVLLVSVVEPDDEETNLDAESCEKHVYVLKLFGVIGARNGRNDYADLFKLMIPKEHLHKFG